jgi:hypothetical protein
MTPAAIGCGENHIDPAHTGLHPYCRQQYAEGQALMNAYSVLANLLRSMNGRKAVAEVRRPVLLPRTSADELPPYREQPWIIDRRGYRRIDPSMTLVPVSRL